MEKSCQNCNRPNPSDATFCRHCASPLSAGQSGFGQPASPEQDRQKQQNQQNQQPWNQPNFGVQPAPNAALSATGGAGQKAMAALGLAVVGLLCCGPLTGIPAAIVGWLEISAIKEGRSPQSGMWMAQVGLWGGIAVSIIHTVLFFLWMLLSMASGPSYY